MGLSKSKTVHREIGARLKAIRIEKNLKIIDVAKMTGLTSSMLSQVERSLISPSIDTLKKISAAFNMPVGCFFDDEIVYKADAEALSVKTAEKSPVVKENQRKMLSPSPGITYYLLNPDLSGPIEMIYNVYEPGSETGKEQFGHAGHECGLILEGELLVTIDGKSYYLQKGDSITFSSELPHMKKNIGSKPCICVWAITPPWF